VLLGWGSGRIRVRRCSAGLRRLTRLPRLSRLAGLTRLAGRREQWLAGATGTDGLAAAAHILGRIPDKFEEARVLTLVAEDAGAAIDLTADTNDRAPYQSGGVDVAGRQILASAGRVVALRSALARCAGAGVGRTRLAGGRIGPRSGIGCCRCVAGLRCA